MTTVAVSKGIMAADTQLSDEEVMYRTQKIDKLDDGSLIGGAGDWWRVYNYIQWIKGGRQGAAPKLKGSCILILRPDKSIWIAEGRAEFPLLNKDNVAIGSGAQAAMALMDGGSSAADAVKQVTVVDPYTSSPIQILSLDTVEPEPKKRRISNRTGL